MIENWTPKLVKLAVFLMQELKRLVAGRVDPHRPHHNKKSPGWGHQNFLVKPHPRGCWKHRQGLFFLRRAMLSQRDQHWGPVTSMDPKVGKPGMGCYKVETVACPACWKNPRHPQWTDIYLWHILTFNSTGLLVQTPLWREPQPSKKRTPLWCEAHFQVKMYKTLQLRITFIRNWDFNKSK